MATGLINQTHNYDISSDSQSPPYASHGPSPASSASPTSPRMTDYLHYAPNPAKQLRPLQKPLYVPAVLRPTEYYAQSPATPRVLAGSMDSLQKREEDAYASALAESDLATHDEELGRVTGPPSRDHWKPDEASSICDSLQCRSSFNLFIRKHHCRHCGHIFCSTHTQHNIPLDQAAKFHPAGVPSRACEACHQQYQRWDTARSIRRKRSNNSSIDEGSLEAETPNQERPGHQRTISGCSKRNEQQAQPAIANSAPEDWAWSTF